MGPTGTKKNSYTFLARLRVLFIVITALAGAGLSSYAAYSTPSTGVAHYTLQLDMRDVNLTVVFPPYSGYSSYADAVSDYSFENSGLSSYYRVGMFGYCGGDIVNGKFKKDHCLKRDPAYPLNPQELLRKEINLTMTNRDSYADYDLGLPDSLPSTKYMRKMSLELYGSVMTGHGLAIWVVLSCLAIIPIVSFNYKKEWHFIVASILMLLMFSNIAWCMASWIALLVGATRPRTMYNRVVNAFNDDYDTYGITASTDSSFFGLLYGSFACEFICWLLICSYLPSCCMGRHKKQSKPTTSVWDSEESAVTGTSNSTKSDQQDGGLPSYDESQRQHFMRLLGIIGESKPK